MECFIDKMDMLKKNNILFYGIFIILLFLDVFKNSVYK